MSRPPKRSAHVDKLEGPEDAKQKLRIILETLTGERTALEARELLGISESRFHQLRDQMLQSALDGLAPKKLGRPVKEEDPPPDISEALAAKVQQLERDLIIAHARTDLALVMPEKLKPHPPRTEDDGAEKRGASSQQPQMTRAMTRAEQKRKRKRSTKRKKPRRPN